MIKITTICAFITLIASCAGSLEYMSVPLQASDWKVGFQTRPKSFGDASYIREFIPKKDDIKNWSKIITIQYIDNKSNVPPKEFAATLISDIKRSCPDTQWNVIEESKRTIIYEWYTKECTAPSNTSDPNIFTPQHEIAKVMFGNTGIHKASYNEKTKNLNSKTRNEWIEKLKNTHLEKDGNVVKLL